LEFVDDLTADSAFEYITSETPTITKFKELYYLFRSLYNVTNSLTDEEIKASETFNAAFLALITKFEAMESYEFTKESNESFYL